MDGPVQSRTPAGDSPSPLAGLRPGVNVLVVYLAVRAHGTAPLGTHAGLLGADAELLFGFPPCLYPAAGALFPVHGNRTLCPYSETKGTLLCLPVVDLQDFDPEPVRQPLHGYRSPYQSYFIASSFHDSLPYS